MTRKRYIRADEEPKKKVEVIGQVRQGNEHCCCQTLLFCKRIDCSFHSKDEEQILYNSCPLPRKDGRDLYVWVEDEAQKLLPVSGAVLKGKTMWLYRLCRAWR